MNTSCFYRQGEMEMNYKSMEELENIEEELLDCNPDDDPYIKMKLIEVYSNMLILMRRQKNYDKNSYAYIKRNIVTHLIQYGTYLKSQSEKNPCEAVRNLQRALRYEPINPIASYRLGFIEYRNKNYSRALVYFNDALNFQKSSTEKSFQLNAQQEKNAYLYLTNSGLHIAKKSYDEMKGKYEELPAELNSYELSILYAHLQSNELYLQNRAFRKVTKEGMEYCSKEKCEEIINSEPENTLILYFNDRNTQLLFNGYERKLYGNRPDILRHLLLRSSKEDPATPMDMMDYFLDTHINGLAPKTYVTAISRLRANLTEVEVPDVIRNIRIGNSPAYYYDGSLPFIVMNRVDEETNF